MKSFNNQSGQGLIEYLILVALMAVASIGVVKILQHTVTAQFSNAVNSLQGTQRKKIQQERIQDRHYKKRDFSDFMKGAVNSKKQ